MPWSLIQLYLVLPAFVLVLFRIGGLMFTAPIFGSQSIPARIKAFSSLALTAMIFPLVAPTMPGTLTLGAMVAGIAGELMIGLIMGFSLTLVFVGLQLGGLMIGQQAGISLAEVFDPVFESQSSIVGELMYFVALMIFLTVNGHQALLEALIDSFAAIPLMGFGMAAGPMELFVGAMNASYGLGLKVAGPALITLFLTGLSMGMISRTMPQMNILAVGFVLRVLAAMAVVAFTFSLLGLPVEEAIADAFGSMREWLELD
jgi:flagellar biosynthesis protein FliR